MKENNSTIIYLNESNYLIFNWIGPVEHLHPYDKIIITLQQENGQQYLLNNKDADYAIHGLYSTITQALDGKGELDPRLKKDLGYLWSEILEDNIPEEPLCTEGRDTYWLGRQYVVWEVPSAVPLNKTTTTWIYTKRNKVIFLVTPNYSWHLTKPKRNKKFIPYEEFITNYKPILKIELDRTRAQKIASWANDLVIDLKKAWNESVEAYKRIHESDS